MYTSIKNYPIVGIDPKYFTPVLLGQDCSTVNIFDKPVIGFYSMPDVIKIGDKEYKTTPRDVPVYLGDSCETGLDIVF